MRKEKEAVIMGIGYAPFCFTNEQVKHFKGKTSGGLLLRLAMKIINKIKEEYDLKKISLVDKSKNKCNGFDIDLRVVLEESYGSALQYFTGSKEHNIVTRKIAIEKGLKLSEYGLFKGSKMIAGKTEEEVYKALKLHYIEPELRENEGEIEAGLNNKLSKIIELKDIKGDLHCHSSWDGGENSIEEMANTAIKKGYEYIIELYEKNCGK